MKLKMPRMGGLPMPEASLPKVPGAPASPKTSSPMKVGEQATVKMPKSKKMADATDKPSVFFKAETAIKKPSIQNLKAFLENSKQKKQSSHSNERLSMDHDKKISAKDAAIAVLAKAHELLSASKLAKSMPAPAAAAASEKEVAPADGVKAQGAPADNYNGNPAPGANPRNLGEDYKGHIKLAKFVGRMEAKRAQKAKAAPAAGPSTPVAELAKATGHEKGVNTSVAAGMSHAGLATRQVKMAQESTGGAAHRSHNEVKGEAKAAHHKVIGEMKAMPKPKLPG